MKKIYLIVLMVLSAFLAKAQSDTIWIKAGGLSRGTVQAMIDSSTLVLGDPGYGLAAVGDTSYKVDTSITIVKAYQQTITGKKYFQDTLKVSSKGIAMESIPNGSVSLFRTNSAGVSFPWFQIKGNAISSEIVMGANNPGSAADILNIYAGYGVNIFSGTYRPFDIQGYDTMTIWGNRYGLYNNNSLVFKAGGGSGSTPIVASFSSSGVFRLNKYAGATYTGVPDYALGVNSIGEVIKSAAIAMSGTATLVGGTIFVNGTSVQAGSKIILTPQEGGTYNGRIRVSSRSVGTGFTVTSSDAGDTVTFAYLIVN